MEWYFQSLGNQQFRISFRFKLWWRRNGMRLEGQWEMENNSEMLFAFINCFLLWFFLFSVKVHALKHITGLSGFHLKDVMC